MFIDTHAHLNFKTFNKDLNEVISRAEKKGVEKIIIPGADFDSSKKAVEISQNFPSCFSSIGIHPHHAQELSDLLLQNEIKQIEDKLLPLCKQKKVIAVGEAGLDYFTYKNHLPLTDQKIKIQKELFLLQLNLAQKNNLPLILHCREAHDDLLKLLTQFNKKRLSGVFHCFGGDKNHLRQVLEMGLYIGFDGNITYPENIKLQNLVELTPLNRILIETDSPFLTPIPFRGQRNEPSNLPYIAQIIARIKNIDLDQIGKNTALNAIRLFGL
ncbi:hypothetical protein A2Y99_02410 [Candidatus Gottesmanbacteria bacterium RBG_13_37_7]|uniref:Hydrolase TatD n=1 Tax=Candidatus Gottesmanbacteria bacterium RBG_13_37_7 TaxID=1798369 RepID=A0A1F5YIZ1_9BACT|nr:MAG: hypothetical protein A2Y99_02410 [Candidatus Gottesmanbacteria bacterium RBG_13_37_7]